MLEGRLDLDGIPVHYQALGQGSLVVHLTDTESQEPLPAHELLARSFRLLILEACPPRGSGPWRRPREIAASIARALERFGIARFNVLGSGDAVATASWLALDTRAFVHALVLEGPTWTDAADGTALASLDVPTLIAVGTADDTPRPVAPAHTTLPANSHLVFVYAAGRRPSTDRPEAFAAVVADFFERREAFVISRTDTLIHP